MKIEFMGNCRGIYQTDQVQLHFRKALREDEELQYIDPFKAVKALSEHVKPALTQFLAPHNYKIEKVWVEAQGAPATISVTHNHRPINSFDLYRLEKLSKEFSSKFNKDLNQEAVKQSEHTAALEEEKSEPHIESGLEQPKLRRSSRLAAASRP